MTIRHLVIPTNARREALTPSLPARGSASHVVMCPLAVRNDSERSQGVTGSGWYPVAAPGT